MGGIDVNDYFDIALLEKNSLNAPGYIFWKDSHSTYIGCNKNMALAANLESSKNISGKRDDDLPWARFAEKYQVDDNQVINYKKDIIMLEPFIEQNQLRIMNTRKSPLCDCNGKVIGLIGCSQLIYSVTCNSLSKNIQFGLTSIPLDKASLKQYFFGITAREAEVLYYLARGNTAKFIAKILKISHRTVERHCENLKNKFSCNNKNELINKAFTYGFIYFIPMTLYKFLFNRSQ